MIKSKNILNKLKILALLPLMVIAMGFFILIYQSYNDLQTFNTLKKNIAKIKHIDMLINEVQIERGISGGYLGSKGQDYYQDLKTQQKLVDKQFHIFIKDCTKNKDMFLSQKIQLTATRLKIFSLKISPSESFDYYTQRIAKLQNIYLGHLVKIEDVYLKNKLNAYTDLTMMKESLGQIRGALNVIYSAKSHSNKLYYRVIHAKGMYDSALRRFEASSSVEMSNRLHQIISSSNFQYINKHLEDIALHNKTEVHQSPREWFSKATLIIDQFYNVEKIYFQDLEQYIQKKYNNAIFELILNILILAFITLIVSTLGFKIKNTIIKNIKLLDEYKNAVDRSSIVSKTDKHGKITYVNDKFCNISGYSATELLGKPHSIVRHPEMQKAAFKDMWDTILDKKPWYGIVKNRKKDGNSYTVEVTINPILDQHGKIEEFIAIRNDITDVLTLHEELENTQRDLIYKMGEIGETRSMETGYHVRRVAKYSQILAQYYGLSDTEIKYLVFASPMHDIGKVGIPDNILNKPAKLTVPEWKIMKTHAKIGFDLFKDSKKPLIQAAAIIAHEHHEKYDGSGYPQGLSGEEIHIYGRITALVDVFDALGSQRSYKDAWKDEDIFTYIKQERGKHFDPKLVDIFFQHLDEFLAIRNFYTEKSSFMKE
jgi:PAS domain S-box-containing protein